MFWNASNESVLVEDRCVIVDVSWYHAHFSVTSQRRAISVKLVVCEHVEVPDSSAARWITVQRLGGEDLTRVFVDDERSVISKLSHQTVSDLRVTINIRVSCTHLSNSQSSTQVLQ